MSVIVVLSDCPPKLRGDMSKWFFEINTGVYVGNINARVREKLWKRITENIGHGHATMVYNAPGEQHMDFKVHNAYWEPVDFDGIKLMRRPEFKTLKGNNEKKETGFSNASKRLMASGRKKVSDDYKEFRETNYVVLDFETTGLDSKNSEIIEIGALLVERGQITEKLQTLVQCRGELPKEITDLTGITQENLEKDGMKLKDAMRQLLDFAEDLPFVCHNASFEQAFLMEAAKQINEDPENRFVDTLKLSQLLLPEMNNHKLTTLAAYFGFTCPDRHRALADCETTYAVYTKLIELTSSEERNNEK